MIDIAKSDLFVYSSHQLDPVAQRHEFDDQ